MKFTHGRQQAKYVLATTHQTSKDAVISSHLTRLVHPREKPLFVASLAINLAALLALAISAPESLLWLLAWPVFGLLYLGWSLGHIRGNAVRVSEEQLPEIHALAAQIAEGMGLEKLPAMYVLQSDGALNAFAAKFVRRDFVVLYSDVADLMWEGGEAELAFVIAHELAHVRRGHPVKSLLVQPVASFLGLSQAYSRACEFTCDRIAAELVPAGAPDGLLVLAAGKRLYRRVDRAAYVSQVDSEKGFWVWLTEKLASHPRLPRRVEALTGDELRASLRDPRAIPTQATAPAVA